MAFATTVFALVDGVLFKPPYERPGELYDVSGGFQQGQRFIDVAPRNLRDWAEAAPGVVITGFMANAAGKATMIAWLESGARMRRPAFL
jgi:hypothetical protein